MKTAINLLHLPSGQEFNSDPTDMTSEELADTTELLSHVSKLDYVILPVYGSKTIFNRVIIPLQQVKRG